MSEIYRVPAGTEMTIELLSYYLSKHKENINSRYQLLQNAYENKYKIYEAPRKSDWKPDNRISINFAKYIVDTFNGFFCGIPVKVTSDDENVSAYIEFLNSYNDQDNGNAEIAKIGDIHGKGNEMYYIDEDGQPCITYLSPLESFFIFDDSILKRPLFFVRFYTDEDGVEHGSWSDSSVVQHFIDDGEIRWVDEPKIHGFPGVPATEFLENEEQMGIFESALPAIDEYNKAISEKANDVDYFADAYLSILGAKIEEEDLEQIRRNRIINFEGDDTCPSVSFLEKPSADATQENLLTKLERLIFQTSMVANISDENFGSSSGIALRYKLQAMNNLYRVKERKFTSAMQKRYKLIFGNPVSMSHGVNSDDWMNVNIKFTPNYPANLSDEADIASKLDGVVSQKTQLSTLSIVDNVDDEIERIEEENNNKQESAMIEGLFGENTNGNGISDELLVQERTGES